MLVLCYFKLFKNDNLKKKFFFNIFRNEADRLHMQHVIEVTQNEGLLHVVKVLCDWMKCHASVITTCAQVRSMYLLLPFLFYTKH